MSIFSVTRQYDEHLSPVVYFHFETDQCWINHGAQFVMEELTFARVNYFFSFDIEIHISYRNKKTVESIMKI